MTDEQYDKLIKDKAKKMSKKKTEELLFRIPSYARKDFDANSRPDRTAKIFSRNRVL